MSPVLSVGDFRLFHGKAFVCTEKYTDANVQNFLDFALVGTKECTYRGYWRWAVYYLAAHYLFLQGERNRMMELAPTGGPAATPQGIMSQASAGDISSTFEFPEYKNMDDKFLASTVYGQEFIAVRNKMARGPLMSMQNWNSLSNPRPWGWQ